MRYIDSKNKKENGFWSLNKFRELCIDVRKERYNVVKKREDGGYKVYRGGVLKFTFDKVVAGNSYDLWDR